ncbi:hypothetical protein D3C71_1130320 [compost metagenome]
MSKSDSTLGLSVRLAHSYARSSKAPYRNRASILLRREDLLQALADGWSVLAIYKALRSEGSLDCSYQTFRRHVKTLRGR